MKRLLVQTYFLGFMIVGIIPAMLGLVMSILGVDPRFSLLVTVILWLICSRRAWVAYQGCSEDAKNRIYKALSLLWFVGQGFGVGAVLGMVVAMLWSDWTLVNVTGVFLTILGSVLGGCFGIRYIRQDV